MRQGFNLITPRKGELLGALCWGEPGAAAAQLLVWEGASKGTLVLGKGWDCVHN